MSAAVLLPLCVFVGVLSGYGAGLLGVGGGAIMVPFLVLAAGMTQHEAEATSLLVVLPTAITASVVLRRRGVGDLGAALRIGLVGAAGGVAGAIAALALPASALSAIFACFLAVVGARMIRVAMRTDATGLPDASDLPRP
jgi:uncharacterized membrane protein YfcA